MKDWQPQHANHPPSLLRLFTSFLRLGITAFGGPAMIAYIRKMAVERNKWLDDESFRDGVALCQTVPGATAMQMAAYVGIKVRGVSGAASSFIGFGLPACILMMTLSAVYTKTHTLPMAISMFNGLQAMIVSIVANAAMTFGRSSLKNRQRRNHSRRCCSHIWIGREPNSRDPVDRSFRAPANAWTIPT